MGFLIMPIDRKDFYGALGFLAVILKDDVVADKRAERAVALAGLIEGFCSVTRPEILAPNHPEHESAASAKQLLNKYIRDLRDIGEARLPDDRIILLDMYKILLAEKIWREQSEFLAFGSEDMIANCIMQMTSEQIEAEAKT